MKKIRCNPLVANLVLTLTFTEFCSKRHAPQAAGLEVSDSERERPPHWQVVVPRARSPRHPFLLRLRLGVTCGRDAEPKTPYHEPSPLPRVGVGVGVGG